MPAAYQELFLEQGTTYSTSVTLDDVYGNPYDLTGVTAASSMSYSYYSVNPTANFVVSIPAPTNGQIVLSMDSATTSNIAPGRYVYDVAIKDSGNNVTRVLEGIINVIPQVTRI